MCATVIWVDFQPPRLSAPLLLLDMRCLSCRLDRLCFERDREEDELSLLNIWWRLDREELDFLRLHLLCSSRLELLAWMSASGLDKTLSWSIM